jgi:hypothetical protein
MTLPPVRDIPGSVAGQTTEMDSPFHNLPSFSLCSKMFRTTKFRPASFRATPLIVSKNGRESNVRDCLNAYRLVDGMQGLTAASLTCIGHWEI